MRRSPWNVAEVDVATSRPVSDEHGFFSEDGLHVSQVLLSARGDIAQRDLDCPGRVGRPPGPGEEEENSTRRWPLVSRVPLGWGALGPFGWPVRMEPSGYRTRPPPGASQRPEETRSGREVSSSIPPLLLRNSGSKITRWFFVLPCPRCIESSAPYREIDNGCGGGVGPAPPWSALVPVVPETPAPSRLAG